MTSTAPAASAASLFAAIAADNSPAAQALAAADEHGFITRALSADPVQSHPFDTIYDVKAANARAGFHFFSRDTLRFFSSRISSHVYGHGVIVTSERNELDGQPRRYSVRLALPTGEVETLGEFQNFATSGQAHAFARKVAALWSPVALAYWAPHVAARRERDEQRRERAAARLSEEDQARLAWGIAATDARD